MWLIKSTLKYYFEREIQGVLGRITVPQRCPCSNSWNLWGSDSVWPGAVLDCGRTGAADLMVTSDQPGVSRWAQESQGPRDEAKSQREMED